MLLWKCCQTAHPPRTLVACCPTIAHLFYLKKGVEANSILLYFIFSIGGTKRIVIKNRQQGGVHIIIIIFYFFIYISSHHDDDVK
jgi:hypothetical protein